MTENELKLEQCRKDREAIERLEKELIVKVEAERVPKHFEEVISGCTYSIRISDAGIKCLTNWPIRLTLLENRTEGRPAREYGDHVGSLPGCTISIDDAKQLIQILSKCIEFVERKQYDRE